MDPHLLYPLVHEALEALLAATGANGCVLTGIAGFSGAVLGDCCLPDQQHLRFDLQPAGTLFVWFRSDDVSGRLQVAVPETLAKICQIIPRHRVPLPTSHKPH